MTLPSSTACGSLKAIDSTAAALSVAVKVNVATYMWIGFLLASVQMAGMLLGLCIGLISEKIGLRRCILIGLGILSLASLIGSLFEHSSLVLLGRMIEGCGFLMVTHSARLAATLDRQVNLHAGVIA